MPIGYRLFQAATAIVPAGQTLAAAVFAFVFGVVQGLSPLDEPAESVTGRVRIPMTVGGHHRRHLVGLRHAGPHGHRRPSPGR